MYVHEPYTNDSLPEEDEKDISMKFMIAIMVLFASPDYTGEDILVIEERAGSQLVFDSLQDCSLYVYNNVGDLRAFAIQSFAPLVTEVHNIACFPINLGEQV